MKKALVALTLVVFVVIFSGCGKKPVPNNDTATAKKIAEALNTDRGKPHSAEECPLARIIGVDPCVYSDRGAKALAINPWVGYEVKPYDENRTPPTLLLAWIARETSSYGQGAVISKMTKNHEVTVTPEGTTRRPWFKVNEPVAYALTVGISSSDARKLVTGACCWTIAHYLAVGSPSNFGEPAIAVAATEPKMVKAVFELEVPDRVDECMKMYRLLVQ